jgi:hypothetical protein
MSTKQQRRRAALLLVSQDIIYDLGNGTWDHLRAEIEALSDELVRRSGLGDAWEAAGKPSDYFGILNVAGITLPAEDEDLIRRAW